MNRWISVKTRLPENYSYNLLLRVMDSDCEKFLSGSYEDDEFSIDDDFHNDIIEYLNITHWMDIVGPDKAGEGD